MTDTVITQIWILIGVNIHTTMTKDNKIHNSIIVINMSLVCKYVSKLQKKERKKRKND